MPIRRSTSRQVPTSQDSPTIRQVGMEVRKQYTQTCTEKGADGKIIAKATTRMYLTLFQQYPEGGRGSLSNSQLEKVAATEHLAERRIFDVPANSPGVGAQIIKLTDESAQDVVDWYRDPDSNGNPHTILFNTEADMTLDGTVFEPSAPSRRSVVESDYVEGQFGRNVFFLVIAIALASLIWGTKSMWLIPDQPSSSYNQVVQ